MRGSKLRWGIGLLVATLGAGCAVGDTVEVRMDRGPKTRPHEPGVDVMVLTTPVGGALDKILEKLRDADPEIRHRDIGDLFAKQGDFADLDLGPDQRRFAYIPTAQGPDVVPIHVSMRDDKPRALWVVASYATRAEGNRVHALRRDGEHRHVHHLKIGRGFIDWDKRPGTDS